MLDQVCQLARNAGDAIMQVYDGTKPMDVVSKADNSPVTAADIAAHTVIMDGLRTLTPDIHKRDIGMVFQNYAIFPHLTVAENVAYGLKAKKCPKEQIPGKVEAALELVQIGKLKDRKPNELSGGQQQRVALARAFVIEPGVLLMDEPLSNLDAKLRVQMRTAIKKLQRRLGITTIYVTHDQEEALAISDRIAVMKEGNIMQVGTPEAIYKKPENTFVAGFIGVSNFVECEVDGKNPEAAVLNIKDECSITCKLKKPYSGKGIISARPEQLFFDETNGLPGKIVMSTFLGDFIEYEIELNNGQTLQLNEYTKKLVLFSQFRWKTQWKEWISPSEHTKSGYNLLF